jgi:ABC-type multidrug transport system fused ATPase/permease subunit
MENETQILTAIQSLKGTKTIVIIAHRESTLRYADHVIRLDKGKIKE